MLPLTAIRDESDTTLLEAFGRVYDLQASQLMAGNGSDQMLGFLIGSFLGEGKKLYTWNPDFSMYDYYAANYGASVLKYDTQEDGSFDLDAFIAYGKENNVDMVLFSNPNNPTGYCLQADKVLEIVNAFSDIPVVVDEAYMDFSDQSVLDQLENYANLYVTRTMSKAYGMAGIRLGFLASSVKNMEQLRPYAVPYALNTITQRIGTIVLKHNDLYVQQTKDTIARREGMYAKLKDFQSITFYPSQANFIRGKVKKNKEQLLALFEQAHIVIRNYADDTFRITIGLEEENQKVLDVLQQFEKENLL